MGAIFILFLALGLWLTWRVGFYFSMHRSSKKQNQFNSAYLAAGLTEASHADSSVFSFSPIDQQGLNLISGRPAIPAVKKELLSGRVPPYDFNATFVRTEINDFAQIYDSYDVSSFMEFVAKFMAASAQAVARYEGVEYEFLGNSMVYYFKDSEHENSFASALSAVRDIGEIAKHLSRLTSLDHGYDLTIKSSLSNGRLRFSHQFGGFGVAGSVMVETARMLAYVSETDGNLVCFDERHRKLSSQLCSDVELMQIEMQGFNESKKIHQYIAHLKLEQVLEELNNAGAGRLQYYRGPSDVRKILTYLRDFELELSEEVVIAAAQQLRAIQITQSDSFTLTLLWNWIYSLAQRCSTSENEPPQRNKPWKLLTTAVSLLQNFSTEADFNPEFDNHLQNLSALPDRRLHATVLQVMTSMKSKVDPEFLHKMQDHSDSRVAASAVIYEGSHAPSKTLFKKLSRMLKSGTAVEVASGIFALGEIAAFHKNKDAGFYKTQTALHGLIRELPRFAFDHDVMIRRQAVRAAWKVNDEKVSAEILKMLENPIFASFKPETEALIQEMGSSAFDKTNKKSA
jgi:adenylate cyclase